MTGFVYRFVKKMPKGLLTLALAPHQRSRLLLKGMMFPYNTLRVMMAGRIHTHTVHDN